MTRYLLIIAALLAAFPVAAQISGEAEVTVSWTPPTEREDGSVLPLAEIAGYSIFYGEQSRFLDGGDQLRPSCGAYPSGPIDNTCYTTAIDLQDGTQTSQVLTFTVNQDTTLWFSMTARDQEGRQSMYSAEASKTIRLVVEAAPDAPIIQTIEMVISCTTGQEPSVTCRFDVR